MNYNSSGKKLYLWAAHCLGKEVALGSREDWWYRDVMEAMSDMILVKGPQSKLLWANRSFREYYGMTEKDLLDIIDSPNSSPDDTLQYVKDDQAVFDTQLELDIPFEPVTRFDGDVNDFHTIKSPIFEDGKVVRTVGVSRLRETLSNGPKEDHRASNKIFTAPLMEIIKTFPLPVLLVDVRKRIVNMSPLWEQTFGSSENLGNSFFSESYLVLTAMEDKLDQCLLSKESIGHSLSVDLKGDLLYFDFKLSPWFYPDGSIGGLTIVSSDVTELNNKIHKIKEIREREQLVVQGTSVGIWDWIDVHRGAEYWSPKFYELLGYEDQEIESSLKNFGDMLHPEDRDRAFEMVDSHFQKGTLFDIEYRLRHKSGEYRWFRGTGKAAFDQDHQPTRMVGAIQDIHDRKIYEEELRRSNDELDQFAYIASHDLREPLRGMRNFAQFLFDDCKEKLNPQDIMHIRTIQKLGTRLDKYLESLRFYSQFGREKMAYQVTDLEVLIAEIVDTFRVSRPGEPLAVELANNFPTISCDSTKLSKILFNLLQNAAKYNESSSKKIQISYLKMNNGLHQFSVRDNGIGIKEKHRDLVFTLFKRLHPDGAFGGGTGLGLTIVKKAVGRHGGKVWVESNEGRGTIFHFTIKEIKHERAS